MIKKSKSKEWEPCLKGEKNQIRIKLKENSNPIDNIK
jgi:hypothetical protein